MLCSVVKQKSSALAIFNFMFKFNFSVKSFKFWIQSSKVSCTGDVFMLCQNVGWNLKKQKLVKIILKVKM